MNNQQPLWSPQQPEPSPDWNSNFPPRDIPSKPWPTDGLNQRQNQQPSQLPPYSQQAFFQQQQTGYAQSPSQPLTPYPQPTYQESTQYAPPPYSSFTPGISSPYPQQPPNKPRKTGFFKKKITMPLWLLILLILLTIGGFSSAVAHSGTSANDKTANTHTDNLTNTSTSVTQNQPTAAPTQAPSPIPTSMPTNVSTLTSPAKVGDTITINGVDCTLISARYLPDDGVIVPKAGNEFVVVRVKLVNNSGADAGYYELDFHARSSSGNVTDSETLISISTYTANDELNSGTLSPGGTVEGDVLLEVPIGDHKAELSWKPMFSGSSTTANLWYLGL